MLRPRRCGSPKNLIAPLSTARARACPWAFWKASALLVIAKETTQTAATIETANVLKMLSQSTNVAGSVFVGNPSILPQVGQLVINIGAQLVSTLLTQSPDGTLQLAGRPSS